MMAPSGSTKNAIYLMMGSLVGARWNNVLFPCIVSVIGLDVAFVISSILNLISLGDDTATTMGINANSSKKICWFAVCGLVLGITTFLIAGNTSIVVMTVVS